MNMINRNLNFAALAMVGAVLVAAGCTPSRSDNRFGGGSPQAEGPGPAPRGFPTASGRIDGRLAFIHAELRITRNQEPRFDTFATAMRANAAARDDFRRTAFGPRRSGTVLERLDRIERVMSFERDELRKLTAGTRPLYAALTPAQRRTANELLEEEIGGRRMLGLMRAAPPFVGRIEGRLAELRTDLRIAPAQEAAW